MSEKHENQNNYIIPPNFIESGTFFGGMFKIRNAIEAGILALSVGVPVFNLDLPLTTKIIIICLTSLPLALLGIIGVSGESLSSFIIIFFKYLKNRRVVGQVRESKTIALKKKIKKNDKIFGSAINFKSGNISKIKIRGQQINDFPAEFDDVKEHSAKKQQKPQPDMPERAIKAEKANRTFVF